MNRNKCVIDLILLNNKVVPNFGSGNLESDHILEIWQSLAPAKFLVRFAGLGAGQCGCRTFS